MADLTVTAGSVLYTSGTTLTANAGETITAGQALYKLAATGAVWKAQCDGTAAEADAVGIALNGGGAGQPISYATHGALLNVGATTAKTTYLVSAAVGGIAPIADITTSTHRIVRLGYATAADGSFVMDIRNTGVSVT